MFASLTLALILGQKSAPDFNPAPGSSRFFQANVQAVIAATEAGDFATAALKLKAFPHLAFTLAWDESNVPVTRRESFRKSIRKAMETWPRFLLGFKINLSNTKPDLKISFVDQLPVDQESGYPQGLAVIMSPDPADPLVEGVIALRRFKPAVEINEFVVYSELNYLIGSYFGLAPSPRPGMIMWRSDSLNPGLSDVNGPEVRTIKQNLQLVERLRDAVAKHQRLTVNKVSAHLNPASINFGTVSQGDPLQKTIEITNNGSGRMSFSVVPDCSCFSVAYSGFVAPNDTSPLRVAINTQDFPGPFHKAIAVYTNDPEMPSRMINFDGFIRPTYRLLMENLQPIVEMSDAGAEATLYLLLDEKHPVKVREVSLAGARATGTFEPWEGTLPDPDMSEGPLKRKGYKVRFHVDPQPLDGRTMVTAIVKTDSKTQAFATANFYLQRGIAANPTTLFFGDIHGPSVSSTVLLPGKTPFRVLKATVQDAHFKTSIEKMSGGMWRVNLEYTGGLASGQFQGALIIETDDRRQPRIELAYLGTLE